MTAKKVPQYLTMYEVQALFRISEQTLLRWVKQEKIVRVKVGHRSLFPRDKVLALLASKERRRA
jgi:excisionase family DNA binding protein